MAPEQTVIWREVPRIAPDEEEEDEGILALEALDSLSQRPVRVDGEACPERTHQSSNGEGHPASIRPVGREGFIFL